MREREGEKKLNNVRRNVFYYERYTRVSSHFRVSSWGGGKKHAHARFPSDITNLLATAGDCARVIFVFFSVFFFFIVYNMRRHRHAYNTKHQVSSFPSSVTVTKSFCPYLRRRRRNGRVCFLFFFLHYRSVNRSAVDDSYLSYIRTSILPRRPSSTVACGFTVSSRRTLNFVTTTLFGGSRFFRSLNRRCVV